MRGPGLGVDLMPFMAILMCFLGALVIIAVTVVMLSVLYPQEVWRLGLAGEKPRTPIVVEWDGVNITIHPERVQVPVAIALDEDGKNASPFGRLLEEIIAQRDEKFLFIIVRPTGFSTFKPFLDLLNEHDINVGYQPMLPDQRITVTMAGEETTP